jgi:hypothetical protein
MKAKMLQEKMNKRNERIKRHTANGVHEIVNRAATPKDVTKIDNDS